MNRFRITKIGLLNFWLYDEEEYDFYGGKLILRGSNGSGKSVTMQSFIPLILDGNKSPDRLDPFGSKERKIEDYIIGDAESVQKEESTAYLYMETYNEKTNKYITIGLGFRGRKGKPVESWGFSLKDGKRVGKDFYLYKDFSSKIPLSKNELKSRLSTINEFTETMKEYKEMVNRLLFGFSNLDTYDEFIKLLLQLRSNKLSKEYKPTNLISVLNSVLKPLTEEDLRPLSEAIEEMNKSKEYIEKLENNSKSLKDFLKSYRNYNETNLIIKARNYQNKKDIYSSKTKNINELKETICAAKNNIQKIKDEYNKVILDIELNMNAKRQIDNKDLKNKTERIYELEQKINVLQSDINNIKLKIEETDEKRIKNNNDIKNNEDIIYKIKKEIDEIIIDLKDLSSDSYFDEIIFFTDELSKNIDSIISFSSLFMSLDRYKSKVNVVKSLLEDEEKITLESERERVKYEKLSNEYKELEKDINTQNKNLKMSIMSWEEDFLNKINNNIYLKIDEYDRKQILDLMNEYSLDNFNKAKEIYINVSRDLINEITKNNIYKEHKKKELEKELDKLKVEYNTLKDKEDYELPLLNIETDSVLNENNITHIPLYKCIEFKDNISDNIKNSIESSLLDLNMLNAKIIKESDINKVINLNKEILFLTKTTKKKNNILKYFNIKLDDKINIESSYIKDILECISIDKEDTLYIDENGLSRVDILNSISDKNYKQSFIGYFKRLELKENKLKEINNNIDIIKKEITNLNNLILSDNDKIEVIETEALNIPSNDNINKIEIFIKELSLRLKINDKEQKEIEKELEVINNKIKEIKIKINEKKEGLYIPLNLESYKSVLNSINNSKELILNLQNIHSNYLNKLELNNRYKEQNEEYISLIEDYKESEYKETKEYKLCNEEIISLKELLETKEYKEQKDKLLEIENNINELNKKEKELSKEETKLEELVKYKNEELDKAQLDTINIEKEYNVYKEIFKREYKLNYVYTDELTDIDVIVKRIIKDYKDKKDISLNDALTKFHTAYNLYNLELNEYSLKNITLFNDYDIEDEMSKIYMDNVRQDITCMYHGIKLNLLELQEKIDDDILEYSILIDKQDRHLFEDILLNTVGEKIRNRINSSYEWVNKINNIMSTMQKESALSFRLVWKSISANTESEIDTKELVRILKMDPGLLKKEDANKVTNHFRSKIKKAEELYEGSLISFYKIIEEVLDYRTWFTFELMYKRKGANEKELTDKVFSKFSGGERAKSMYIPLFAGVYAKLNLAKEDSLRIIALDEAFAGVDEDNIREMFGILKYLDLDFVINSQMLWGDYDTIDDLSICEIIRPNNSSTVGVERYRWNGSYKEIIDDRKKYNEELENA